MLIGGSGTGVRGSGMFNARFRVGGQSCRTSMDSESPVHHPATGEICEGCLCDTPISTLSLAFCTFGFGFNPNPKSVNFHDTENRQRPCRIIIWRETNHLRVCLA
ncbi:hypothetical protein TNCV_3450091 [Trichonephila clavipes]|uniref:Uncharacterized protein n=1 Tax=Trichonephila clavipes TaxID=2585209 RepID=A0A8X6WLN2_TRICX|nr:hypothetical protein TNCV_3450091 [Trichonephila clavipes]